MEKICCRPQDPFHGGRFIGYWVYVTTEKSVECQLFLKPPWLFPLNQSVIPDIMALSITVNPKVSLQNSPPNYPHAFLPIWPSSLSWRSCMVKNHKRGSVGRLPSVSFYPLFLFLSHKHTFFPNQAWQISSILYEHHLRCSRASKGSSLPLGWNQTGSILLPLGISVCKPVPNLLVGSFASHPLDFSSAEGGKEARRIFHSSVSLRRHHRSSTFFARIFTGSSSLKLPDANASSGRGSLNLSILLNTTVALGLFGLHTSASRVHQCRPHLILQRYPKLI